MNVSNKKNLDESILLPSLRDLLSPLFRHKRLVVATFCGVFLFSVLIAWRWASHYYVARMQVIVEQNRSDPAITSVQNTSIPSSKSVSTDQISSEVALLKGSDMYRSIVVTCGLVPDTLWSPSDMFISPLPSARRP